MQKSFSIIFQFILIWTLLNCHQSDKFVEKGLKFKAKGEYELAIKAYDRAIEIDPDNFEAYNNKGVIYEIQRDYLSALENFNKSIYLDSTYLLAYLNRGLLFARIDSFKESIRDLDIVLKSDSMVNRAYYYRGISHYILNNYSLAKKDLLKVSKENDIDGKASFHLGYIYHDEGNIKLSSSYFRQGLDIFTDDKNLYDFGHFWFSINELDSAEYYLTKSIDFKSNKYNYSLRGLVRSNKHLPKDALSDYSKAISFDSTDCNIFYNRAFVYLDLDSSDLACRDFKKSLKLGCTVQIDNICK